MRNKRLLIVLAGAVIFGLITAVSVGRYLSNAQAYTKDLNTVLVAKVDIPVGTKIIAEQLIPVQFPPNATPDGTFNAPEKLVGRVAAMHIPAREPITDYKLAAEGTEAGLVGVIPEGYRAMTVKVDDVVGISGFIRPGTLVDIVVVINPTNNNQDPISKIVLQNIKVLANGQNLDKPKDEREPEAVKAVTLQVTPEQAEKLALAATEGKLQLVMRNSIDQDDAQTSGVNKRSLLSGEHAMPIPDPGSLKTEQPSKPANSAPSTTMPRRMRSSLNMSGEEGKNSSASNNTAPQQPRATVEMIEGSKRRTVDFP
jgi:pilus assembly protein CpaB